VHGPLTRDDERALAAGELPQAEEGARPRAEENGSFAMSIPHMLVALCIVAVWGLNFVVMKLGLQDLPPFLFGACRFSLVALPAIFFCKRPTAAYPLILAFGLVMFSLQFGLLFSALRWGTTAGLASLVLQVQVFFTLGFASLLLGERPSWGQLAGALVAFTGIGLVARNLGGDMSPIGLTLVLAAAAAWGAGNLLGKRLSVHHQEEVTLLALVSWGGLVSAIPLFLLSWWLEQDFWHNPSHALTWGAALALGYNAWPVSLIGFALWNWLMRHYPATTVAPFSLLVPLFGFAGSALFLGEPLQPWKWEAAALILTGLGLSQIRPRPKAQPLT